jgi:cytosine/adenosine deaminase-related metal-dependent hydrolase
MSEPLLVAGGTVITVDPQRRMIEDGAVAIEAGRIAAVGPQAEVAAQFPAARRIDASGHAVLPGLIDGHAHAGHGLIKTLGDGDSAAWSAACRTVYTTASPPAFWHADARLAALERLLCGTTTGVSLLGGGDSVMRTDRPDHAIAHARGVAEIGIRDVVAVGPTRPPHPWRYADWQGEARTEHDVDFARQFATIEAVIEACHGRGRQMVATLMPVFRDAAAQAALIDEVAREGQAVRALGRRHGTLFHQDGHGSGSLALADRRFGLLGPDAAMSHCTELTGEDIDALVRTGTHVVHNPSAIAAVLGYCPVPALQARGVNVLLGSDGTAPDRSADMFRHMFVCRRLHQREHRDEHLMPPGRVLDMVTIDAARGLGLECELGSLEVGKRADLITVDLRRPHLAPRNMPVWRVVCFANGADVDTVIVDGEVLMQGRRVAHVDVQEVLDAAEAQTAQMLRRAGLEGMMATSWPGFRPAPDRG